MIAMMTKTCIICKELKENSFFNEEHIIPAAIGGNFKIYNVCQSCNSQLGKTIDYNFLRNAGILHYRNIFNLTRQNSGSVPNPFKGTHLDSEGNKHLVEYKAGTLVTQSLETFEVNKIPGENKSIARLTIPLAKMDQQDSIIQKYFERNNIESDKYVVKSIERNEPKSEVKVTAILDNNTFIFGCVKIAYETINMLFPSAIEDEQINQVRKFLLTSELSESLHSVLEKGSELNSFYKEKLATIENLGSNHQIILIEYIDNIGLVCMVRIFDMMYPVILSKTFKPINAGHEIVLFNDCLSSLHGSNISHTILNASVNIDLAAVSTSLAQHVREIGGSEFFKIKDRTPVFDCSGNVIFEDVLALGERYLNEKGNQHSWTQLQIKFDVNQNTYFLKGPKTPLVPILSVTINLGVNLQKITGTKS